MFTSSKFAPKAQGTSMFTSGTAGILEKDSPETLPEGVTRLIVTDVIDLGIQHSQYGDKRKLSVILESQVPSARYPGRKVRIKMTATASLSDASTFGSFVKSLGLDNNVPKFSVSQLAGISFDGGVTNTASKTTGVLYSNLDGVVPGTVQVPVQNI